MALFLLSAFITFLKVIWMTETPPKAFFQHGNGKRVRVLRFSDEKKPFHCSPLQFFP